MGMQVNELYNLEPSQFVNKYEGYKSQRETDQFYMASFMYRSAVLPIQKDKPSLNEWLELFPWFGDVKDKLKEDEKEWANNMRNGKN